MGIDLEKEQRFWNRLAASADGARASAAEQQYRRLRASLDVLELAMRAKGLNHVTGVWSLLQSALAEAEDLRKIMDWKSVDADG